MIRAVQLEDASAIAAIYNHYVEQTDISFEEQSVSDELMRERIAQLSALYPWLVCVDGDQLLGYAYANHFRPRLAYRFCVEDSIYLHPDAQGRGVGKLLLTELMTRCEAAGARQMLAVIGDAANAGSIGVHAALGFAHTGVLKAAGWKFERWLDVVLMQRHLGQGDATPGSV